MSLTIQDIARLAGVSKATVSAVLNDKQGISRETRERVWAVMEKVHYKPNQIARSLSKRETRTIGLVVKEIDNPYFARVIKGVFDRCSQLGYNVLLGSSELSPDLEQRSVDALVSQKVDGLILSPLEGETIDCSHIAALVNKRYPLVTLNKITNFHTSLVEIDNQKAAYEAISFLLELGHRKIAFFAGPPHSVPSRTRLEGFRRAFSDRGLPIPEKYIVPTGSYIRDGYRQGKEVFTATQDRPTAVFCFNDLVAIGLIKALTEMGIQIPGQTSVVGFDDIAYSEFLPIPLTTVRVPAYEIGAGAAELLIEQIHNKDDFRQKRIVLEAQLIKRKSTGQAPCDQESGNHAL